MKFDIMKLMTIQEVAELLRISKSTIYKMVMDRRIPFIKASGRLLFDEVEIRDWVKASQIPTCKNNRIKPTQLLKPRNRSG